MIVTAVFFGLITPTQPGDVVRTSTRKYIPAPFEVVRWAGMTSTLRSVGLHATAVGAGFVGVGTNAVGRCGSPDCDGRVRVRAGGVVGNGCGGRTVLVTVTAGRPGLVGAEGGTVEIGTPDVAAALGSPESLVVALGFDDVPGVFELAGIWADAGVWAVAGVDAVPVGVGVLAVGVGVGVGDWSRSATGVCAAFGPPAFGLPPRLLSSAHTSTIARMAATPTIARRAQYVFEFCSPTGRSMPLIKGSLSGRLPPNR